MTHFWTWTTPFISPPHVKFGESQTCQKCILSAVDTELAPKAYILSCKIFSGHANPNHQQKPMGCFSYD